MTQLVIDLSHSAEVEEAHITTVQQQISENEIKNGESRIRIANYRQAILSEQESMRLRTTDLAKLRRKKRIFSRARFELQQVDED